MLATLLRPDAGSARIFGHDIVEDADAVRSACVEDLSAQPLLASEGEFYGRRFASGVVCPAARARRMRFTA